MTSDSEDDFQTVGYAKRIPRTPRSKSVPNRKIKPCSSPDRRLTPSSRSRLERDHRLAIREGSPSPLSKKMKKERDLTGSSIRSPISSKSNLVYLSSGSSTNSTPVNSQSPPNSVKRDSTRSKPWSDAENVCLWKAVLKYGDGNVNWSEVEEIVNKVSYTTRSKPAVLQHWDKLRKDIVTYLDPTNSAADIDAAADQPQDRKRRSLSASRSGLHGSPSLSLLSRSRHTSRTVKKE